VTANLIANINGDKMHVRTSSSLANITKKKIPACRHEPLFSGNRETFIETFLRLFQFVFKCGCTVTALPVLIFRASTGSWKRTGRTQSLIYVLTKCIKRCGTEFTEPRTSEWKKDCFCMYTYNLIAKFF